MAEINTIKIFNLDGVSVRFPVTFEYLARKFVRVTLKGGDSRELTLVTEFVFENNTTVKLLRAWGPDDGYTSVEIRRVTSTTDRIVDFQDATVLRAADLNVSTVQSLHIVEEARDDRVDSIGVDALGNLDAKLKKVVNVADPQGPLDAVNLRSMNTEYSGIKAAAESALAVANAIDGKAQAALDKSTLALIQAQEALWPGDPEFGCVGDGRDDWEGLQRCFDRSTQLGRVVDLRGHVYSTSKTLRYGTCRTDTQQSSHGPGIISSAGYAGLQALPPLSGSGTQYLLEATNTSGLRLEMWRAFATGCRGINTAFFRPAPSQQNFYSYVWVDGYTDTGWRMDSNNDSTMQHLVVRGPSAPDPTGIYLVAAGGLVSMTDCFWYGSKIVGGWQNAIFTGCGGMGIEYASSGDFNSTAFVGCYLYTNDYSKHILWHSDHAYVGARVDSINSIGSLWVMVGGTGDSAFKIVVRGIARWQGDKFDAANSVAGQVIFDSAIRAYAGVNAKVSLVGATLEGYPIVVGVPSGGGVVLLESESSERNGTPLPDVRYGSGAGNVWSKSTPNEVTLGSSRDASGATRRGYSAFATRGVWNMVGLSGIYRGVGTLRIFGYGNGSPVLNMSFGRPTTNPESTQTVVHQIFPGTDGTALDISWAGGDYLKWRYTSGPDTKVLQVSEDYISM